MANLKQLLTEREVNSLRKVLDQHSFEKEISSLTWDDMNDIGLELMVTEFGEYPPDSIIGAEAIVILTRRAMDRKIDLF